ncbi:MAG TPA: hypothetical protein VJ867_14625 [Gemmatimonadaceae bacterium]|nr:hypothetical protein [Gemmatimonadaceae bacterium]
MNRRGAAKGCLMMLLLVVGALYVGIPVGETYLRYAEYKDAMKQEVRFRANLSNDKIRAHLAAQADSLGLPEEAGDVTVTRNGNQVTVEAEYDEIVRVLGLTKAIHFAPSAVDTY